MQILNARERVEALVRNKNGLLPSSTVLLPVLMKENHDENKRHFSGRSFFKEHICSWGDKH